MKNPLPREIVPGVFWLGQCLEQHFQGKVYHSYTAAFLIIGSESSLLVETGHPGDFAEINRQVKDIVLPKESKIEHLFITHQETPHSGGLGRFLEEYSDLKTIYGDTSDYHLAFPEHLEKLRHMKIGDSINLGDRDFTVVEPVIRDMRTTLWGVDMKERVLFPGDGFAYSHYHWDGHCGKTAEEAESLDLIDVSAVFAERALFWTKYVDMNIYVDRLEEVIEEFDIKVIAPTHGLPIKNIAQTLPKIRKGLVAAKA